MPDASFKIKLEKTTEFTKNGRDVIALLLNTNKGANFGPIKKIASGGELSRIMLCIKAILAKYIQLPAIIFDEIDTGVSGAISEKVAQIMQQMSETMQVFAITHLPQVAAKGNFHYKVYKSNADGLTFSNLKQLSKPERLDEIAQMLSGSNISNSALAHAKQLLK